MKNSKNEAVEAAEIDTIEVTTPVEETTTEGVAERKHRQNRNTLAAMLRSRTKILWPSNKGTFNVGKNKAKRAAKQKSI